MENEVINEIKNDENIDINEILVSTTEDDIKNVDSSTNCLALTVREDYHVAVFKNFVKKSARISWKIAISILTMNFLNMFLWKNRPK